MKQYVLTLFQPDGPPPEPAVLAPAPESAVVRMRGEEAFTTDGPCTEGKEHVGGFTVVRAPDMEAALGRAREIARAAAVLPVEVREFRP